MGVFKRSGRSGLYVRICIPAHLQVFFDGRESFVKSLDTSEPSIAELRSKVVTGKASALFLHVQKQGYTMTPARLRFLVSRYIGARLDEWEESIASSGLDDKVNGQWQDGLSAFAQSAVDESAAALRSLRQADDGLVREFLERYKLAMEPGSPAYRMLARELVKAEKVIQGKIKERAQGEYGTE